MRKAKIVGTLGPSSDSVEKIAELIRAGLNVARINMSHGTHEGHEQVIKNVREASRLVEREVAILLDLQGPKIRVDKLPSPLKLEDGSTWVIGHSDLKDQYPEYKDCFIPTIYKDLVKDCEEGTRILFDDGYITAEALEQDRDVYKIKIQVGGELKSNKGINLPDVDVSAPSFTEKDHEDLMFGLTQEIDYIALSFVRKKEDILLVMNILHKLKLHIPIVAKIEKPQAVTNIDEILDVTDVIMVARGDMGVEVGNHLVPSIQKQIISKCNERGIPVITATQMLESMISHVSPTRAESSDVANAVWDGTDALMLSGETASGKFPIEAVKMMSSIIKEAEKTPKPRSLIKEMDLSSVDSAVMLSASLVAEKVSAKRILSVTESGNSCLRMSRFRPLTPVLGITNNIETVRRICLYWGVHPFYLTEYDEDSLSLQNDVLYMVKEDLGLQGGDKIVFTRGDGKFFSKGSSNSIRVEVIKNLSPV
jgi:pyruvate kinase